MNSVPQRLIAVTMGDPAGIGPEIICQIWRARSASTPRFLVFGDPCVFRPLPIAPCHGRKEALEAFDLSLPICPVLLPGLSAPGKPDPANAPTIISCIEQAVEAVLSGLCDGVVTAPISKSVLQAGGFGFPGHTEFLDHLTLTQKSPLPRGPVMMLAGRGLRAALVTIHTPLGAVPSLLNVERIIRVGQIVDNALRRLFGVDHPRLALCGLNPHAGEQGRMGHEEQSIINPAAHQLRELGIDIGDARPADTLFHEQARHGYDAVIAMYHDQGLIPVKTLDFHGAVNITLGLPIIRTSPDHGTAFDIAGKGMARTDSFAAALNLADSFARRLASS
jgi:4-hydroxythreonine-4-phosphate dehydrogenase